MYRPLSALTRRALHTCRIPKDLSTVTYRDAAAEKPQAAGIKPEAAEAVWRSVESLYRTGTHPGIQISLRHRGQSVLHRAIGHAHGNGPDDSRDTPRVAMTTDTPVCYFSASKAVTAFLIHLLAEQGLVNLMDPVAYYCPEFAQNGKRNITLHQILSHRGGIPAIPGDTPPEVLWNPEEFWRLLCEARAMKVDGSKVSYHAITGGFVLQRVLEAVTGLSLVQYLDRYVRKPMGMTWFTYGVAPDDLTAPATNYATGPRPTWPVSRIVKGALGSDIKSVEAITNDTRFQQAVIPAGNLYGTAEEMGRFFQMMLSGGVWNGQRICSEITVQRAIQQFGSLQIDHTLMLPMRFSAGMMLGGDPVGIWGPNTRYAFGHVGLINKFCWADSARDISVSLLTTGFPIVGHHLPALGKFLYSVSTAFPQLPEGERMHVGV